MEKLNKKEAAIIVVVSVLAVLLCVRFGYNLGIQQVTQPVVSHQTTTSSDLVATRPLERPNISEIIDRSDPLAWLWMPAASLISEDKIIKAELSTDANWQEGTSYSVDLKLPDAVFGDELDCIAQVYYPTSVRAGETSTIAVVLKADNDYVYCGYCQFTAVDDLQIVYGSHWDQVASGGEFSVSDCDRLKINFYTSATPEHYKHRSGHAARYDGRYGNIDVDFITFDQPQPTGI